MSYYETVSEWIDRQEWSEEKKTSARMLVRRRDELRLNPMTAGEWARWAEGYESRHHD